MGRPKGSGHSEATRAKMSATRKGRKHSPEHVAKLVAGLRKHWDAARLPEEELKRRQSLRRRKKTLQKYGLTEAQYQEMLADQGGVCAICTEPPTEDEALTVDHNHSTGAVRGLLCRMCNLVIGNAKDRKEVLSNAILYLERTSGN